MTRTLALSLCLLAQAAAADDSFARFSRWRLGGFIGTSYDLDVICFSKMGDWSWAGLP